MRYEDNIATTDEDERMVFGTMMSGKLKIMEMMRMVKKTRRRTEIPLNKALWMWMCMTKMEMSSEKKTLQKD
jgi:hypothetical protein